MTVAVGNADNRCCQLEKAHYLGEALSFQYKPESVAGQSRVNIKLDIINLLQSATDVMNRLIFKNKDSIAPCTIPIRIDIFTDNRLPIPNCQMFAGLQRHAVFGIGRPDFPFHPKYARATTFPSTKVTEVFRS